MTFISEPGRIVAVGGGAGCVLRSLHRQVTLTTCAFIAADTNRYALESTHVPHRIWLTDNETGPDDPAQLTPDEARYYTYESLDRLAAVLRGGSWAVVLVCLGGATGLAATPVVCTLARQLGLPTALLATLPFQFEGRLRRVLAEDGLATLPSTADSALLLDNEVLYTHLPLRGSMRHAFNASDALLIRTLQQLIQTAQRPGLPQRSPDQPACNWRKVL